MGRRIPSEINAVWISAQLTEVTSSLETMIRPSEILPGNHSVLLRTSALPVPLPGGAASPSRAGGCDRLVALTHRISACAVSGVVLLVVLTTFPFDCGNDASSPR